MILKIDNYSHTFFINQISVCFKDGSCRDQWFHHCDSSFCPVTSSFTAFVIVMWAYFSYFHFIMYFVVADIMYSLNFENCLIKCTFICFFPQDLKPNNIGVNQNVELKVRNQFNFLFVACHSNLTLQENGRTKMV